MLKKIFSFVLALIISIGIVSGCADVGKQDNEKINIVCTIFPQYDWMREIIKGAEEKFNLTLLVKNGTDLHSFQPSAGDIIKIESCDMIVYVGGNSDVWIEDALKKSEDKHTKISMLAAIGDKAEEEKIVEGMEHEHHDMAVEDVKEMDEHVWLSLKNAEIICRNIADELGNVDSQNKDLYRKNADEYIAKLNSLDSEYQATVDNSAIKTLIFADRFPFRYMTDDYKILYYAAFPGCSAESEASFETIAFLAKKLNDEKLPAVITIDSGNQDIAGTVIENTESKNQKILSLNSLQSINQNDIENGETYLSAMSENLVVLKEALN